MARPATQGFKCEATKNGEWRDHKGIDFISADRTDDTHSWWVTRTWTVAVVHENGKVTEVLVNTWLTGP